MSPEHLRYVRNLINDECILRVPKGSKELPAMAGGYWAWQFYLRRALLDPRCLQLVCIDFWNKFEKTFTDQPFQIGGVEAASVPIITALVLEAAARGYDLRAFTIRKSRKDYGKRNLIEGKPSLDPVVFIDDLTSPSHTTFWHAVYALGQHDLSLHSRGYVLVHKIGSAEPRTVATSIGVVKIESLFTLADFSLSLDDYQAEQARKRLACASAAE